MQQKIKVLQTIRQGKIGGGESHLLTLVNNLDRAYFEPIVLSFTEGPMVDELLEKGVKVYVIPSNRAFDVTTWQKVRGLIKEEGIQLVHAHGSRALTNVAYACRKEKLPLVYTVHGWSFHESLSAPVYYIRMLAEGWLSSRTQKNICVSEANRVYGQQHIPNFKADVIMNGIDLQRFNPERALYDVRKEYNIQENQIVIGFVARMTIQKDPVSMVEAFAKIADKYPQAVLLMIGSGELKDEVKSRIKELKITNRVVLDDFRQDVPELLKAIDIFCLPSLWEGMPIALIEALAMKKAIIASAVDGTKELIRNEVNGLTIPAQQPVRLAEAISKLIDNEDLRTQVCTNARQSIIGVFDAETMTRKVEKVYQSILQKEQPLMSVTN